MADVTPERIEAVRADIAHAVARTSSHPPLPEREQDRLLAQACAGACGLIQDWLASGWWDSVRPRGDGPTEELVLNHQHFERFLDQTFKDALAKAAQDGVSVPPWLVDKSRAAVAATAGRHRRMRHQQLFERANDIVSKLGTEVCGLASDLISKASDANRRKKAREALMKVSGLMLSLAVAMAGVGPHQMSQNLSEWEREAVKVIMICFDQIFDHAPPDTILSVGLGPDFLPPVSGLVQGAASADSLGVRPERASDLTAGLLKEGSRPTTLPTEHDPQPGPGQIDPAGGGLTDVDGS